MFAYGLSFIIAGIGVAIFQLFELPLPWLLGPIFACLIAALCGIKFKTIIMVNNLMRTVLGVAVGASITLVFLGHLLSIWQSLVSVIIMILLIALLGVPYFYKIWKYDFITSYYAAMPGGLQDMLLFGQEAGANIRTLSLVHATRVLVVVVILPIILIEFWDVNLNNPPGASIANIDGMQLLVMAFAGIVGWQLAKKIKLFGASILGPLLLSAFLSLLGVLEQRPPAEAIWAAQFFIGMAVGVNYVGIQIRELKHDVVASLGFCILLAIITWIVFTVTNLLALTLPLNLLLALTPGGQAEITVLAIIVGADVSFVIAHHILRIFFVILLAPIIAKIFKTQHE